MSSLPSLNERDFNLVVSYSASGTERITDTVVNAFQAANIDVFEKPTTLSDWVNVDVLEDIRWTSGHSYFGTQIWDHHVVITAEEVRIYTSPDCA